jgi:hypothetical protein
MCDDGGDLIECNHCGFFYCYDEQPQLLDDPESVTTHRGCVTLPPGYVEDTWTQFNCPDCLSEHPGLSLDVSKILPDLRVMTPSNLWL